MSPPDEETIDLLALLDELRIIAENGLEYADDPYDEERYSRLLELVEQHYGRSLRLPRESVRQQLGQEIGHVTPKVGATAAVFDDRRRVLTMKRPSGAWCLPGGNTDPGERPERTAVRETREETGLDVEPIELVDAFLLPPGTEYDPHGAVTLVYRCTPVGGELELSREGLALEWSHAEEVPEWFFDHGEYAREAKRRI
jgi:8-oxo-dGTP pyrophosphatase MutT (NUDIX family)